MKTDIYRSSVEDIYVLFGTSEQGLSSKQVEAKQELGESNELRKQKVSLAKIFFLQYYNFLMLLLSFGAILSVYLGQYIDGYVIIAILIVNGALGTVQEYKAEKLAEALSALIPQKARVRRDGRESIVERKDLVCGDIVLLDNGQLVPADLRIVKNFGLVVNESMLTGESSGVVKSEGPLKVQKPGTHEMKNMLFNGTIITEGGCEGVVVATGESTEFGKIISFTHHTKKHSSFLQQVNNLSNFLFKTTVLLSGILFVALVVFKPQLGINNVFLFAIAMSIAIVPEMLPLISTIALTRASLALIKKGVLVKRLSSLEDLGGVEVICADKTGTLTKNVLQVSQILGSDEQACLGAALRCSKRALDKDSILAGSFDAAVWKKANPQLKDMVKEVNYIWQGAFDPSFRWQFAVTKEDGLARLSIKGAPESIIERCKLSQAQKIEILRTSKDLGEKGLRVLAVSEKSVPTRKTYDKNSISNLTYLGLLVFKDPIKESVAGTLEKSQQLGVKIKILTGDAPEVALRVANEVGMDLIASEVVTGYELSRLSPEHKIKTIHQTKIFARVNPKEKYEIIQAIGKRNSVMFLGEGINDAPALKSADVGMVVEEASDIAKESADVILTKPDLESIIESIYLGRQIMSNIAKYILITLTGNFGSLYGISLISLVSPVLPLLPTQVLLENILTDVPMVQLVNSPIRTDEQRKPIRQNIQEICFNSTILGLSTLIIQFIFYRMYASLPIDLFRTLWLMEIILFEFTLIISLRTFDWFWKAGKLTVSTLIFFAFVIFGTLAIPFVPLVNKWFHLQPYNLFYLIPITGLILLGLVMTETMKRFLFRADTRNRIAQDYTRSSYLKSRQ